MKTCLIVDDSSVIRKIARRIVEGVGLDVIEAENGQQAIEICEAKMPTGILLDWNMPVMDGYQFLRSLRSLRSMSGGGEPKVVFCTTEHSVSHINQALECGANEYIMKPFDKDIVEAKFREIDLI